MSILTAIKQKLCFHYYIIKSFGWYRADDNDASKGSYYHWRAECIHCGRVMFHKTHSNDSESKLDIYRSMLGMSFHDN